MKFQRKWRTLRTLPPQTLEGSFSAVSKRIFAIKYSLESAWRDLQDKLQTRNRKYQKFSIFFKILQILQDFDDFLRRSRNVDENLPDFHEISSEFFGIFKKMKRGWGPGKNPDKNPDKNPEKNLAHSRPLAGGGGIWDSGRSRTLPGEGGGKKVLEGAHVNSFLRWMSWSTCARNLYRVGLR